MGTFCGYTCSCNLFDMYYSNRDDDFVAVHAVQGASDSWEKSVTPVTNAWRVEVCSAHSFLPYVKDFPEDVPTFVMRQREAPQVTVEVEADGNCFFRLYW